jgi:hypothetical protein
MATKKKLARTRQDALRTAVEAFSVCTKNGFATLDGGALIPDMLDKTQESLAWSVADWCNAICFASGITWEKLERGALRWIEPPEVEFRCGTIPCLMHQSARPHVCFYKCFALKPYDALLAAYRFLRAERRCLARDADRAFAILKPFTRDPVPGYDALNAFDWYVLQIAMLKSLNVRVAGFETETRFSRPIPQGLAAQAVQQ